MDGLPVRRWVRDWVWVSPPPPPPTTTAPSLPLPKDSHLLTPMALALLSAARAGTLDQPTPEPKEGENAEQEGEGEKLFRVKRWVRLPKERETDDDEFPKQQPVPKGLKERIWVVKEDDTREERFIDVQTSLDQGLNKTGTPVAPPPETQRRRPPPRRKGGQRGRRPGRKV